MTFAKWMSIGRFHNAVKAVKRFNPGAVVTYRAKIKLDGTNAAVRIKDGVVTTQSRNRDITPDDDNYGFSRWAHSVDWDQSGVDQIISGANRIIYGEWCGQGILNRTAIGQFDKEFCVFAVEVNGTFSVQPDVLKMFAPEVHVLPWETDPIVVDFADPHSISAFADQVNADVEAVDKCDPWVKRVHGVEGTGEGLVYYPQGGEPLEAFIFKAKGQTHSETKERKAATVCPELLTKAHEFALKFVTDARCRQAGVEPDMSNTGQFLKWVNLDVKKESVDELDAMGLEWKSVAKQVTNVAKDWWVKECRKI